ncbi:hypothetical protein [Halalkalibacter flavus]|uniref:hypothetical protein n=1 Tax=Halalkalibacter flavus TaxID=3090668 RepID=UPI002FCBDFEE
MVYVVEHKQTKEDSKRKDTVTFYPRDNRTIFNELSFYGETNIDEVSDEECAVAAILEGMERAERIGGAKSYLVNTERRFLDALDEA